MVFQVEYGDRHLLDVLAAGHFRGRVHSVFAHALNFQDKQSGELYTLGHPSIKGGPNTLLVSSAPKFSTRVSQGDSVTLTDQGLLFGTNLVLDVGKAVPIDYQLTNQLVDLTVIKANCQDVTAQLTSLATIGSFYGNAPELTDLQVTVQDLLKRQVAQLMSALVDKDWQLANHAAKGLLGLGPGLTPSGDDFLLGLITTMKLNGFPLNDYQKWVDEVLALASQRTNLISYTALKKTNQGQVKETLNNWLRSMIGANSDFNNLGLLCEVLDFGSTSGVDSVIGVINGLNLFITLKE